MCNKKFEYILCCYRTTSLSHQRSKLSISKHTNRHVIWSYLTFISLESQHIPQTALSQAEPIRSLSYCARWAFGTLSCHGAMCRPENRAISNIKRHRTHMDSDNNRTRQRYSQNRSDFYPKKVNSLILHFRRGELSVGRALAWNSFSPISGITRIPSIPLNHKRRPHTTNKIHVIWHRPHTNTVI